MTLRTSMHPEDMVRCGVIFGKVADEVQDCISRARTCATVRWVGRPNQAYQKRLGEVARDLSRIQSAYEGACNAVLAYADALGAVRDVATRADLAGAQADDLEKAQALSSWHDATAFVPDPQVADLRARYQALQFEAAEMAQQAAWTLSATLRSLTHDAPHTSSWMGLDRGVARFSQGFTQTVEVQAGLVQDAVQALPWVTDEKARMAARAELWQAAKDTVDLKSQVEQLLDSLHSGQYAHTGGALSATFVLRGHGGKTEMLFGAHNYLPGEVLWALTRVESSEAAVSLEAWVLEHSQANFDKERKAFAKLPAPTLDELVENGVNLVQQEALGGHTVLKHLGRDVAFLNRRIEGDDTAKKGASAFYTQREAEYWIDKTLRLPGNAERIRAWMADPKDEMLQITGPSEGAGVFVPSLGRIQKSTETVIRFVLDKKGQLVIKTAFVR